VKGQRSRPAVILARRAALLTKKSTTFARCICVEKRRAIWQKASFWEFSRLSCSFQGWHVFTVFPLLDRVRRTFNDFVTKKPVCFLIARLGSGKERQCRKLQFYKMPNTNYNYKFKVYYNYYENVYILIILK
jgi:hypothetical protein